MGMMMHRWKLRHNQAESAQEDTWEEGRPLVQIEEENKNDGVVYTRDEINALPFFSLKSVATKYGIDVKGKKAIELRNELIEKLEL